MRLRSTTARGVPAAPIDMPRDVEAVEAVIDELDRGVASEKDAHATITATLVRELCLGYGAVWLPAGDGTFRLQAESGPLAATMGTTPGARVDRITSADGFGGEAIRSRKAVVVGETSDPKACLRWAGARVAGATSGCLVPAVGRACSTSPGRQVRGGPGRA
jgi:hypothetical protein